MDVAGPIAVNDEVGASIPLHAIISSFSWPKTRPCVALSTALPMKTPEAVRRHAAGRRASRELACVLNPDGQLAGDIESRQSAIANHVALVFERLIR